MSGDTSTSMFDSVNGPLTRRQLLRSAALVGGAAVFAPVLSGCGDGGTSASPSAAPSAAKGPKKGGSLRIGLVGGSSKDTLDGQVPIAEVENCFTFQLYNALLGWDKDYKPINLLAEEVTANATADQWTIRIKPDVEFHNGKTLSSDDVVYSIKRILDPSSPKNGATGLGLSLRPTGIHKIDERTVRLTLDKPNAVFNEQFSNYSNCILPVDFDPHTPVGTGPFKFKSHRPGEQAVFVANKNYWGEGPYVDDVTIFEFAEPSTRVNALLGDTVDAISQLPRGQASTIANSDTAEVLQAHTGAWISFTMATDQKPLDDVRVRQAMRLIIDRPQMLEQAYSGYGRVGNDMYSPFDPGYPNDLPQRQQDLEQAKSLLKQAGQEGLSITLNTSETVGGSAVAAAQVFAEQAKGAGVNVKVNKIDPSVYWGDNYLKYTFAQTFYYTHNYLYQTTLNTLPGSIWDEVHMHNPKWEATVKEAFRTVDSQKRNELIAEAETIEHNEGGHIIWAFNDQLDAYSKKLGGVSPYKDGIPLAGFRFNLFYFV